MDKDLILCGLRQNFKKLEFSTSLFDEMHQYYYFNSGKTTISINKKPFYENKVKDYRINKILPSFLKETEYILKYFRYYVEAFNKKFDITEEEYNKLIEDFENYFENYSNTNKKNHLESLCKKS